jgi:hypothetical protein
MKRRWFQIHLSTAVVMMFVAGALLGLNFIQRVNDNKLIRDAIFNGWPFPVVTYAEWDSPDKSSIMISDNTSWLRVELEPPKWHDKGIAMNALLGIVFFTVAASLSEYMIHCREARKP